MNSNETLNEVRVEFLDNTEQPLFGGYAATGAVPVPAVGDTFQGSPPGFTGESTTYVVERRHFHIAGGQLTARIYGRDIQVTGGL